MLRESVEVLTELIVPEPVHVLRLDVHRERTLNDQSVGNRGGLPHLLLKAHADHVPERTLGEASVEQGAENLAQKFRVLLVQQLQHEQAVVRGPVFLLVVAGEQTDFFAHGSEAYTCRDGRPQRNEIAHPRATPARANSSERGGPAARGRAIITRTRLATLLDEPIQITFRCRIMGKNHFAARLHFLGTAVVTGCALLSVAACSKENNITNAPAAGGAGGQTAQAGAGGGSSGPDLTKLATACSADADCGDGLKCLDEPTSGWPKGYCYVPPSGGSCPSGAVLFVSAPHTVTPYAGGIAEVPICGKPCSTDGDCGKSAQGYQCLGSYDAASKTYGKTACAAWVQADDQCAGNAADLGLHRCVPLDSRGSAPPGTPCTSDTPSCDGFCVTKSNANGDCATGCVSTDDDCNTGFKCVGLPFTDLPKPAPGYCLAKCDKTADCKNEGDTCDVTHGVCLPP